jgi:5-methylcytosine-specific restriction endonuclease McrA
MTTNISSALGDLSDSELLARLRHAVHDECAATARLIALLMEVDTRRLYLGEGCSSLFTYCTQVLHLSEHAAYNRIETARAARKFAIILDLVESGAVTLTAVRLLAPHLTDINYHEVLRRATHMSKRQVELLIATLHPTPDEPSVVRKLPTPSAKHVIAAELPTCELKGKTDPVAVLTIAPQLRPAEVKPLAPERFKIQVTVSRQAYDKLRRAQDLLRYAIPNGDPSPIIGRALEALVDQLERTKTAATQRPRATRESRKDSRYVPAAVRRVVWQRDGGRCGFQGAQGRCTETGFLEYHHVLPFAEGGDSSISNLQLRCRAHNQYEADLWFSAPNTLCAREERACFERSAARSGTSRTRQYSLSSTIQREARHEPRSDGHDVVRYEVDFRPERQMSEQSLLESEPEVPDGGPVIAGFRVVTGDPVSRERVRSRKTGDDLAYLQSVETFEAGASSLVRPRRDEWFDSEVSGDRNRDANLRGDGQLTVEVVDAERRIGGNTRC